MPTPRVQRQKGPKGTLTQNNYRRKALPHLKRDFENRCAYCLQHLSEQHINQNHVEHFNSHLSGRRKHLYNNLMLACSACNLSKLAKKIKDPASPQRRLLNCTEETEFPEHIIEDEQTGHWLAQTQPGDYQIITCDLNESSHLKRRRHRTNIYTTIHTLEESAIRYSGSIHPEHLKELQASLDALREELRTCVPFPRNDGLFYPVPGKAATPVTSLK